ncbi:MAG: DNA-binding response regulator, partial [Pseudomonadota bacterium]
MVDTDTDTATDAPLRTLIVDDEPLAVERTQVICAELSSIRVVGTASDGAA